MDPKHSLGPDRIDYQESPGDLTEVHAAIRREAPEPTVAVTPIPVWLTAICGVAVAVSGIYLGLFHGGFRPDIFNERLSSPSLLFPEAGKTAGATNAAPLTLAEQGKSVYANCVPCHQPNGNGLPGQFPPLSKSEWVNGGEKRMVAILLKGLQGPVKVEGATFNGQMPAWEKTLNDKKIAAVISYVRSNFGNAAAEVSEAKVAAARAEFAGKADSWTEGQLQQIPEDATLPDAAGAAPAPGAPATPATPATPGTAPAVPATTPGAAAPASPGAPVVAAASGTMSPEKMMAMGRMSYMAICVACHQPTGMGLPMVFPPLAKSEYVNGPPERFAAMILKGNIGPMTVAGKPFNNVMPGQEATLTDERIAAVMTFVRANFENNSPAVGVEVVTAARAKFADRKVPWTEVELKAWKID